MATWRTATRVSRGNRTWAAGGGFGIEIVIDRRLVVLVLCIVLLLPPASPRLNTRLSEKVLDMNLPATAVFVADRNPSRGSQKWRHDVIEPRGERGTTRGSSGTVVYTYVTCPPNTLPSILPHYSLACSRQSFPITTTTFRGPSGDNASGGHSGERGKRDEIAG